MNTDRKIVDAFAEWDDRGQAFRVYLVREDAEGNADMDNASPMEAEILGDSAEARIHKAAFVAHPKDFRGEHDRVCGWTTEKAAARAAKAVKAELARVDAGKPGPSDLAVQIAAVLARGRR